MFSQNTVKVREREKAVIQLELARIESDSSSMIIETDLARVTATGFSLFVDLGPIVAPR